MLLPEVVSSLIAKSTVEKSVNQVMIVSNDCKGSEMQEQGCGGNCADISIKRSKDARMFKEFKFNESTRIRGGNKKSLFDYLLN
jgi:hypothetical protein